MEENKSKNGLKSGPFVQLLEYRPEAEGAGAFPPPGIWFYDLYRVLYGLTGTKGDEMRKAELSVYDGVPFSTGLSGRKKIKALKEKSDPSCQVYKTCSNFIMFICRSIFAEAYFDYLPEHIL